MSKKTREQKIKNTQARAAQKESAPISTSAHHFTFTSSSSLKTAKPVNAMQDATYTYLRKDIIKTVVLAIAAIGALIILSFVMK